LFVGVATVVVVVVDGAVVVVVGATVVVVVGATVVVVVGATVVVVVGATVVVVVGATVVVVVGPTVVVVVVGATVVVVDPTVVVVVVGATVVVVVATVSRITCAAGGGVMACVVLGWVMNPPVTARRGVVVPGGSKGPAWPNCAGPGLLAALNPVNKHVVVVADPVPGVPPNGTTMLPAKIRSAVESTSVIPMLALPPATPFVVKTLPVLNVGSTNVRLLPVPIVAGPAAAVVGVLIVALDPLAATLTIVEPATMPPPDGPATNEPTSVARNVPAAAVRVVDPLVHDTLAIWRPRLGRSANVCVYVKVPVAVPSVDPTFAVTLTPMVGEKIVWFAPAMMGPISVIDAVPLAPNAAPVGAMLSGEAVISSPMMNGAVWPAPKPVPMQSAS